MSIMHDDDYIEMYTPFTTKYYDVLRNNFTDVEITYLQRGDDTLGFRAKHFDSVECDGYIFIPTNVFNEITSDQPITTSSPYILCVVIAVYGCEEITVSQVLYEEVDTIPPKIRAYAALMDINLSAEE